MIVGAKFMWIDVFFLAQLRRQVKKETEQWILSCLTCVGVHAVGVFMILRARAERQSGFYPIYGGRRGGQTRAGWLTPSGPSGPPLIS